MTIYITYKDGNFNASAEAPEKGFIHAAYEEFLSDVAADVPCSAYDDDLRSLQDAICDGQLMAAIHEDGCLSEEEFQGRIEDLHDLLSNI